MFWSWLITVLTSICLGILISLLLQVYFYKKYFSEEVCETKNDKKFDEHLLLPQVLSDLLRKEEVPPNDSCTAINLLLQFLFHELRDTEKVRKWFRKKLSLEFEQLLASSAIGRMIASIKIREIHLGSEFPVLNNISVANVQTSENYSHVDTLDLKLDLHYCGNFRLAIDVNMLLGKAACISITVNELVGEGRLQFNRLPYSHWSFTFYNDPKLQLNVESQFQGRAYQQITTLISNQIRKMVRRKHTLPNFKLRYKPFFDVFSCASIALTVAPGQLQVSMHRVSRLIEDLASNREIYILAGTDSLPWLEIRNYGSSNYILMDVVITKKSQAPGLHFKLEFMEDRDENCLILDEFKPGAIESEEELVPGDIVLAVSGKKVNSINQLNKFIRAMPQQFILRLERLVSSSKIDEVSTTPQNSNECPIYSGLRRRKGSESESCGSTPSTSLPGSPARRNYFRTTVENARASGPQREVVHNCDELCQKIMKTKTLPYSQIVAFDEVFHFNVKSDERYLNLNVRAKENEAQPDKLLGYLNIPLTVLMSGDYLKNFHWKPSDALAPVRHSLSCQNGFEPKLCYGDVVFSAQFTTNGTLTPSSPSSASISLLSESQFSISESSETIQVNIPAEEKKHDFMRTHFTSSTQCDFCGKKIWFKDAEKCRDCGMSCHRKCVLRCKSETACVPQTSVSKICTDLSGNPIPMSSISTTTFNVEDVDSSPHKNLQKPEIVTTCVEDTTPQTTPKKGLGGLLANVASRSLKRVGSANNLVPPGGQFPLIQSKSLPPSPQQSPAPSRKPSLPTELSDEITTVLETLMQQGSNQSDLMYFAKESGKTLYEELDIVERKEKIQDMINKLKSAINSETESRVALHKDEQNTKDPTGKAKIAFLIGKSDEKTQALATLMLHFCAGLQHIQDLEEQEREIEIGTDPMQDQSLELT